MRTVFGLFTRSTEGRSAAALKELKAGCQKLLSEAGTSNGEAVAAEVIRLWGELSDAGRAAFFDFKGDVLGSGVLAKATSVTLTPTAVVKDGDAIVAFAATFEAAFPQSGKIAGKLFAEHCNTMDE